MFCRKEMVKILKCYLIPKKSYGTLSKGAIFFLANPVYTITEKFKGKKSTSTWSLPQVAEPMKKQQADSMKQ